MKREMPNRRIEKITILAKDEIRPYGGRIDVGSESLRKEFALRLLKIPEKSNGEIQEKPRQKSIGKRLN